VVVVPFFISDGLHSYEDIPVLLGIADERSTRLRQGSGGASISENRNEIFRRGPYQIDDRALFYGSSIGTDPRIADIIVELAEASDSIA
jgi:sirohydrochlorin cobaltochelatase